MDMKDGLTRSQPCPTCATAMIWTQNAWQAGDTAAAAYRCSNGHTIDPATTRQCPACGVHDTTMVSDVEPRQQFRCNRCGELFEHPR